MSIKLDAFANNNCGILFEDAKGKIIYHNEYFFGIFNIDKSGKYSLNDESSELKKIISDAILYSKSDNCRIREIYEEGNYIYGEKFVLKDFSVISCYYYPLVYGDSQYYLWQFFKIRENIDLKESIVKEARAQLSLNSSGHGSWEWNIKSGTVSFSKKYKELYNVGKDDINLTGLWKKNVHPDDIKELLLKLDKHIKRQTQGFVSEHRVTDSDGLYKWVRDRGKVVLRDPSGNPHIMMGTTYDISKEKENENLLIKLLKKEKELNELKSNFISKTSHEFRNPLATMMVTVESLEKYFDRMSGVSRLNKIKSLKNNVIFLRDIIEKVLDLSHINSGKIKFEPEKVNMTGFLYELIRDMDLNINLKHYIEFDRPSVNVMAYVDKQMIKQIINNILSNSFKYSPEWTTVKIELKAKNNDTIINISDQGIGISDDDREKIFEPFCRGSNVGNTKGSGLGLALSMQFIRYHRGRIDLFSPSGEGTVVTITLPGSSDI